MGRSVSLPELITRRRYAQVTSRSHRRRSRRDYTRRRRLLRPGDYRAEVWVKGRRLGLADARVVDNAKDLKNVPAGFVGVQKGKSLTFAFRLELGIVGSITVAPVNPFIEVGASVQLSAIVRDVRDATMTGVTVTWRSADSTIARVSSTGLVTGVSEDATVITATAGNVSANDTIAVVRASVASVVVSPPTSSIKEKELAPASA